MAFLPVKGIKKGSITGINNSFLMIVSWIEGLVTEMHEVWFGRRWSIEVRVSTKKTQKERFRGPNAN